VRLVSDIESDGLLDSITKIHMIVHRDIDTGKVHIFSSVDPIHTIEAGLAMAQVADLTVWHNGISYDIPAIQKLYPWFSLAPKKVIDTLVYARLVYPDLWDIDTKLYEKGKLPGSLRKRQSLEAWGYRLGDYKGDYEGDPLIADEKERKARKWERWNQAMQDYCVQDTGVTLKLFLKLEGKEYARESIDIEHAVAWVVARQERHGFMFDKRAAARLLALLVKEKLRQEEELATVFKPLWMRDGPIFTPKRDDKKRGYVAGVPFQKIKLTEFNPGSRDHIALWLKRLYGWKPEEFTNDGKPKVDETVLNGLQYPEAKALQKYLMVGKRLGQLAEGKEAWLKNEKNGRMHGSVNSNGAVTGRMTHSRPNMAQVPASYSPYGHECRALFMVPKGKKLVGSDAAALELRDLAGYMAAYDGGDYVKVVLEGDKSKGTDIHSVNARALGLDPKGTYFDGESGRDIAKTWFYAFIYGAGDEKLGFITARVKGPKARSAGKKSRADFMRNLPALGKLVERVKAAVKERGFLKGLDGRILHIRSQHAALNTLLQSAGAVQMKKAIQLADAEYQSRGWVPGVKYEFVALVHDEAQIEADEDIAEEVGRIFVESIRKAGEYFKFKCPLDGEYQVGSNWAETH
jgi:DNA polymerase I-like protein with 3'-5' exonuclease and polymerase domains